MPVPKRNEKAGSSVNKVKECITNLCRVLKHGKVCQEIIPDHFRLAKANNKEGEEHMMHLIVSTAAYLGYDAPSDDASKLDITLDIAEKYKYPRLSSLKCVDEATETSRSKELLFCFAWILHSTRLLHNISQKALKQCNAISLHQKQNKSDEDAIPSSHEAEKFSLTAYSHLSDAEKIGNMCCCLRKIELLRNRLLLAQNGMAKIEGKVMKETRNSVGYFTPNEVMMIKHPELMKQCEKELESKVQVLQAYIKWKEMEPSFWTWLDNAMEVDSESKLDMLSPDDCPQIKGKINLLTDKIAELKCTLYEKETQWLMTAKENSDKILKLQQHQEHEIYETVQELYHRIRSLHHTPQFLPLNDADRPSFRFGEAKHIRSEVKRVNELIEMVSENMDQDRLEHAKQLTDILHSKLGNGVNFVQAVDFSKAVDETESVQVEE